MVRAWLGRERCSTDPHREARYMKMESHGLGGSHTARAPALGPCSASTMPCVLSMADTPAGLEESISHKPVPHSRRGHRFASQGKKHLGLDLLLISTNLKNPLVPLVAAMVYCPRTHTSPFSCAQWVGFNSSTLLLLVDVGLLELAKPHIIIFFGRDPQDHWIQPLNHLWNCPMS